ncbi:MAG: MEKHLA domain-containing protein [Actinomycetota bacterium]|nr:MEKHLA domain-containing protein [Actinomycetota bacterium]
MRPQGLGTGSEENERRVHESEERYRSFIEQSTEGIWRFELEEPVPTDLALDEQIERFYCHCYLAECNDVMARIYGYARAEEIVGARLKDLLSSSIPENVQYLKDFVCSGYQLTDAESQEVDRYGRTKYFLNDLTGIVEKGYLLRVWGTQRDITERKRHEEDRARLAAIVESSEDAIIAKTLEGVITDWNRGAQKIYGYSAEEVLGKPINILVPPDRQNEIPMILERLRRGEAIDHYETVRVAKDGRRLDISLAISPIRDSAGNIRGASTIARNITERKRDEKALKESEWLYRTVIEQATENIFLVDAETRRVVESNRAFQQTLGYTEEELRSMTLYDIVAADRKSINSNIQRILEQRHRSVGERKFRRKDGSLVDVEVSVSAIVRNGRETLCNVAHDITERKRREEAQRFLAQVGATLSTSLDYRATLASVARLAVPRLADWCAIDIVEEDGSLERLAVEHEDPQKVQLAHELQERYPPDPEAQQGVLRVVRSGQSEFYPDITDEMIVTAARDAEHLRLMREIGFVSLIFVPLVARGRTLGVITLVSAESGRRYREADVELAEELARHAALAVDNARLYRGRVQVARTLQEGLLPSRLPEVPGVEVGLCYVSAGEVDVGGDFYDLFDTRRATQNGSSEPSSSWGMVIGDVSGKGAEAAAMLAFARYTIRALAKCESCPSTVLSSLNEAMLHQRRERGDYKFCTATYVRLEAEGNAAHGARITVSRGGHPPPFLLRTDGSIYKVGEPGRVIGVFNDVKVTEQEASLAPGDALILYTDGVVEARSPDGLFFGEERLMALLRSSVTLDASIIAGRIEDAVLNFQEQTLRDDVAVMVLRISD